MDDKMKRFTGIILVLFQLSLSGCFAAAGGVFLAGAAAGVVTIVNLARDQYPDIDFDKPAPVETFYSYDYGRVWNAVIDSLMEMQESTAVMDKSSGIIRTNRKNLNDVSWIGKGLGKATFRYEYNITVRQKQGMISVAASVPFWEEKMFIAQKEKNIPEGSNTMRHILYRNINQKITPRSARFTDSPTQDIRYAPLTKETARTNDVHTPAPAIVGDKLAQAAPAPSSKNTKDFQRSESAKYVRIKSHYSRVNIRPDPSTNNPPVAVLSGGDEIGILEESGDWLRIKFYYQGKNDCAGWIYKFLVEGYNKPVSPEPAEKEKDISPL